MKENVKTYGNGKQVLECANCHIDKEKYAKKELSPLKSDTRSISNPCPECGSKKRYSLIENGKEVVRCVNCDAIT
jgi:Zn-finger protein